jgi:HEAT repeat protein
MNDKPTMELIRIALGDADPEETTRWQIIDILARRGTPDVFETARRLCLADGAAEKCLGCHLLGRLASFKRPDFDDGMAVLLPMLESENEPRVLECVISALGHAQDPRAVGPVMRHLGHPNPQVRWHIVLMLTACGERDDSVSALIDYTKDSDALVRDWACHGLGSAWQFDTPALRDALADRLDDPDDYVRGEAFVGLALRHDERVVAPLARELEAKTFEQCPTDYAHEALRALGNASEFPELRIWEDVANDESREI